MCFRDSGCSVIDLFNIWIFPDNLTQIPPLVTLGRDDKGRSLYSLHPVGVIKGDPSTHLSTRLTNPKVGNGEFSILPYQNDVPISELLLLLDFKFEKTNRCPLIAKIDRNQNVS